MKFAQIYPGVYLIELDPVLDERGFFARMFCKEEFARYGLETNFPQCNLSYNRKANTLRGLHAQGSPYEEVKLVKCIKGAIYDVAVDPINKKYTSSVLTNSNHRMLYIPKGFFHGYLTLEPNTEVMYFTSTPYTPSHEISLSWNSEEFKIDWPLNGEPFLSERDKA